VAGDPGETRDLAREHPAMIESLVADGLEWSRTLEEPQWHDTEAGAKSWEENEMPKYPKTFELR
jgi:hypothetical protein